MRSRLEKLLLRRWFALYVAWCSTGGNASSCQQNWMFKMYQPNEGKRMWTGKHCLSLFFCVNQQISFFFQAKGWELDPCFFGKNHQFERHHSIFNVFFGCVVGLTHGPMASCRGFEALSDLPNQVPWMRLHCWVMLATPHQKNTKLPYADRLKNTSYEMFQVNVMMNIEYNITDSGVYSDFYYLYYFPLMLGTLPWILFDYSVALNVPILTISSKLGNRPCT